jgi:hypothetical protein
METGPTLIEIRNSLARKNHRYVRETVFIEIAGNKRIYRQRGVVWIQEGRSINLCRESTAAVA